MPGRKKGLSGFDRLLRDFAEDRGIYGWSALHRELERVGLTASRTTLGNWVIGKHPVDYEALPFIVRALELTEEEQRRLAWAFAFEQD